MRPDPSKPIRSVIKGVSYRMFSMPVSPILAYALTGSWVLAGKLGVCEAVIKVILFYVHERVWHQIPFGKVDNAILEETSPGTDARGLPPQ